MRVPLRMPAAERVSMARGVIWRERARMASGMPGTSRSMTSLVASGVQSRGEKPVPPVVSTRSATPSSAMRRSSPASSSRSSGRRAVWTTG